MSGLGLSTLAASIKQPMNSTHQDVHMGWNRPKYRKPPPFSDLLIITIAHVMAAIDFAADGFLSSFAYSVHLWHYLPTALQLTFVAALTISIGLSNRVTTEMPLSQSL